MATYTSTNFFDWILGIVDQVAIFNSGTNYILPLIIVLVSAILISPRKLSNIKVLALPLMVGYTIVGLKIPLLYLVIGGIVFVMEILSTKGLGEGIRALSQRVTEVVELPSKIKEKRISGREKELSYVRRDKELRKAEEKKEIPFRKGTTISDVQELHLNKKYKGTKLSRAENKELLRLMKKKKEEYWGVEE